jgi:hypothetical protein
MQSDDHSYIVRSIKLQKPFELAAESFKWRVDMCFNTGD